MAAPSSRRQVQLVTLIITVFIFSLLQYLIFNSKVGTYVATTAVDKADEYIFSRRRKLRVAIVNTQLAHDEVILPLVDAWMQIPQTEITTYQVGYRFGMEKVLEDSGYPAEMNDYLYAGEFKKIGKDDRYPVPDIVVSTTCIKDTVHMEATWKYLLENHHTHFFCVFHHANQLQNGRSAYARVMHRLSPYIRADRIDFVALSEHVAEYALNDQLARKWPVVKDELHHPPVRVFPPVYYVKTKAEDSNSVGSGDRAGGFALQGEYAKGRDYPTVFTHLQDFIEQARARKESEDSINLHLVGFGQHPDVPNGLEKHVIFDERLDYTEFYGTLSQVDAVLTAFSSDDYYLVKASSTVPAALIAGTAIIGDKKLLQTYTYLDESVIWMQEEGESDMETVGRVLTLSKEEKAAKKAAVRSWTEDLIEKNYANVREWTEIAMAKFPEDWYLR